MVCTVATASRRISHWSSGLLSVHRPLPLRSRSVYNIAVGVDKHVLIVPGCAVAKCIFKILTACNEKLLPSSLKSALLYWGLWWFCIKNSESWNAALQCVCLWCRSCRWLRPMKTRTVPAERDWEVHSLIIKPAACLQSLCLCDLDVICSLVWASRCSPGRLTPLETQVLCLLGYNW